MSKVLISKNIPAIANELLKKAGFTPETLNSDVSLSSLDPLQLQEVVGIISMLADPIDDQFLEKTPQLKVISNYAVGFNNLDLVALQKRNILVGNTPEVLTEASGTSFNEHAQSHPCQSRCLRWKLARFSSAGFFRANTF